MIKFDQVESVHDSALILLKDSLQIYRYLPRMLHDYSSSMLYRINLYAPEEIIENNQGYLI